MALPKIQDLITYVSKVITGSDWNTNWQTVVSWLSSGNTDIKVKSIELSASGGIVNNGSLTQEGNVSIGGNLAVTGSVTGSTFTGDGSGLTGIVSSATVSYTPFAVNSGNVDVDGNGDILYFTGGTGTLNFKVGGTLPAYDSIVATSAQGVTFTLTQILDLDVSTYDDGTYVVCIKKNQTVAEVRGTVYRQIDEPTGNNGDLWLDTGKERLICYEKISGSWSNEYEGVPVGTVTVNTGVCSAVETFDYNYNGYNINNVKETRHLVTSWSIPDYTAGVAKSLNTPHTATENGIIVAVGTIESSGGVWVNINGNETQIYLGYGNGSADSISLPVKKGDVYQITNTPGSTSRRLTFYPII